MKKILLNKTILSVEDLFLRIDKRLAIKELKKVERNAQKQANESIFAFNRFFFKKYIFLSLLRVYKDKKFISFYRYILILTGFRAVFFYKIIKFLFKKNNIIWDIKYPKNQSTVNITFTMATNRLIPKVEDYNNILDLKYFYTEHKFNIVQKIRIILYSLKYDIDINLVAQYFYLKLNINKKFFKNKIFIIEECLDTNRQILTDIISEIVDKLIISYRGIANNCVGFPKKACILVSNKLSYDVFSNCNNCVKTVNISISKLNKKAFWNFDDSEIIKIAYFSDLGNYPFTYKDKKYIDEFMCKIARKNNFKLYISIHPQSTDLKYYYDLVDGKNIFIRKEKNINKFFDDKHIVVGCISTTIFQAFMYKKPIILLDLFKDFYYEENYLNPENTKGLIQVVSNEKEFINALNFFKNLSYDIKKLNQLYESTDILKGDCK